MYPFPTRGEHCKLPQQGSRHSPDQKRIYNFLALKYGLWYSTQLLFREMETVRPIELLYFLASTLATSNQR